MTDDELRALRTRLVRMAGFSPHAEDIAQDVLLAALRGKGFDFPDSYWWTCVRNRIKDYRRQEHNNLPLDTAFGVSISDDLLIEQRDRLRELAAEAGPVKLAALIAYHNSTAIHTQNERVKHSRMIHGPQAPRIRASVQEPKRHCGECGAPIGRGKRLCDQHREERKLARERAWHKEHYAYVPVKATGCRECGIEIEGRSEGCHLCYSRHYQREYRMRSGDGLPNSSGN